MGKPIEAVRLGTKGGVVVVVVGVIHGNEAAGLLITDKLQELSLIHISEPTRPY